MIRTSFLMACLVLVAQALPSQGFNLTGFSNVSGLGLNGSTVQSGSILRITGSTLQTGSAWYGMALPVAAGFDTTFQFRIIPPVGGILAEGMSFCVQNDPQGPATIGGDIWSLGYGVNNSPGILSSVAVEIDTFQDGFLGDTSNNELTIHTRGALGNNENESFSIGRTTPAVNMADGAIHTLRVQYVPGTITVFLDNLSVPVLSAPFDLLTGGTYLSGAPVGGLNLPNGTAFVGFTAATGANNLFQTTEILSWSLNATPLLAPCFEGTVGTGSGGPFDVVQINGSAGGFQRTVSVNTFEAFNLDVLQPPSSIQPSPFILFAIAGPQPGGVPGLPLGFGTLCFPVTLPPQPGTFTLANSFFTDPSAVFPASAAPWTLALPTSAITSPLTLTLQGVMAESVSPLGLGTTNAITLDVVTAPPPAISSISPLSAPVGTAITITGTGFSSAAGLTVGGIPTSPTTITPTQIGFPYPAGLACDAPLVVANPDGSTAAGTLNPTPVVTSTPISSGPAAGGTGMLIIGSGFASGSTVTFAGLAGTVTSASFNLIQVTTPTGTPGSALVVITTPGGCSTTTTFTYL